MVETAPEEETDWSTAVSPPVLPAPLGTNAAVLVHGTAVEAAASGAANTEAATGTLQAAAALTLGRGMPTVEEREGDAGAAGTGGEFGDTGSPFTTIGDGPLW